MTFVHSECDVPSTLFFFFLGSRRQQPILLEEPVFLHQSAEDIKQAHQVETLEDNGEILDVLINVSF